MTDRKGKQTIQRTFFHIAHTDRIDDLITPFLQATGFVEFLEKPQILWLTNCNNKKKQQF